MHADHRKPVLAFVVLAVVAAVLVGFQRADAGTGRFLTSFATATAHAEGTLTRPAGRPVDGAERVVALARAWFDAPADRGQVAGDPPALWRGGPPAAKRGPEGAGPTRSRSARARATTGAVAGPVVVPGRSGHRPSGAGMRRAAKAGRAAVARLGRVRPAQTARERFVHGSSHHRRPGSR